MKEKVLSVLKYLASHPQGWPAVFNYLWGHPGEDGYLKEVVGKLAGVAKVEEKIVQKFLDLLQAAPAEKRDPFFNLVLSGQVGGNYLNEAAERFAAKIGVVEPAQPSAEKEDEKKAKRREIINQAARAVGFPLSQQEINKILSWVNFSEAGIRAHFQRKRATKAIDDACIEAEIQPKASWLLAPLVVNAKATAKEIAEALKQGRSADEIKELFKKGQVTVGTKVTGIGSEAYQEARDEILRIAQEVGYTPQIGGDGYWENIHTHTTLLASAKGPQVQETKDQARTAFQAVVETQKILREVK